MTRLALALALGLAAPLAAQGGVQVSGGLDATSLHTASDVGSAGTKLSGVLLGGSGRLTYRALSLDLDYRQGSLQPAGGGISQEGVEGALLLGVSPRPWLTIRVGPHARTYVAPSGTQRWLMWELRGRAEGDLVPGTPLRGYVELWDVASADVNVTETLDSGRGGEGGMLFRVRPPVWLRLSYGIEHLRLGSGARLETVDRLFFGATFDRR